MLHAACEFIRVALNSIHSSICGFLNKKEFFQTRYMLREVLPELSIVISCNVCVAIKILRENMQCLRLRQ